MGGHRFDYLSGAVGIAAPAPESWRADHHLPFWEEPNHPAWGRTLSRVLYHEAIHFWHLLASGYLANLIAEEWLRLLHYEQSGEIRPRSARSLGHRQAGAMPFSADELAECWARHWDVHTRSPAQVIADEQIPVDDPAALRLGAAYTGNAFDTFMQRGPDSRRYARPYRWLLEQLGGASAVAAIIFPIVAHAAFGSPAPVAVFCGAVARVAAADRLRSRLAGRSGSVNLDWLSLWGIVQAELVEPVLEELRLPSFTGGFDVIDRGALASHPIFGEYPAKATLRGWLALHRPLPDPEEPHGARLAEALVRAAELDPWVVFGLPGQPYYRRALGELVPPPTLRFSNLTWHAHRPITLIMAERAALAEASGRALAAGEPPPVAAVAETYAEAAPALDRRIARFRAAEKAVALGLPADAFAAAGG